MIAARHLQRHGCVVLAANLRVGRAEIDLIVRDGSETAAVEVKAGPSAVLHFTGDKEATLRAAMARLDPPVRRLDLVTVEQRRSGVLVRWFRRV